MEKNRTAFILIAAAQAAVLAAYIAASIMNSQFWGDIISPISALLSAGILMASYIKSERRKRATLTLFFASIACFAWAIADILWGVFAFAGADPESSPVICAFYALTNLFILVSLLIITAQKTQKWSMAQFYNDLAFISLITCFFIWAVFLNKDAAILYDLMSMDFTSIFSLVSDILIFIIIYSWFLSRRSGKIPLFAGVIAYGIVLYTITDVVYYVIYYKGLYIPNSIIDIVYALSLACMAFGALLRMYKSNLSFDEVIVTNIGRKKTWVYLLSYPLLTIALAASGAMSIRLKAKDFAIYLSLIIMHTALSRYIQLSSEYQRLLQKEKEMNQILERRVEEKVKELTFLANYDPLTNLYNRRAFLKYLQESIQSKRSNEILALLFIDMDHFKNINDHFGHDIGDKVLIELSGRMREWNSYGAAISRLGGDEFAVVFIGKYTRKEIEDYCGELIKLCNKPICFEDKSFSVTISVGIAMHADDARDADTIMRNADLAMYCAKAQGYNRYQFYNPLLCNEIDNKNKISVMLKKPDIEAEFDMYYQPQFSLPDMRLIGAEALIRWNSAEYGYIPPKIFIPVSEEIGLIHKIGKWAIFTAAKQAQIWNNAEMPRRLKVGINISPKQIEDEGFIDILTSLIENSGVDATCLDFEVTENSIMSREEKIAAVFKFLKGAGFTISIDDFGAGYSALGYLNKYPFDRIKIDKSLIENISSGNVKDINVVKGIISMAKSIGVITIAEGVEKQEQLDILQDLGCDQAQGYLLGRPVPADLFERNFLNANT